MHLFVLIITFSVSESDDIEKSILLPFASDQDVISAVFKIDDVKFSTCRGVDFMLPHANESHSEWLKKLTVHVLEMFASETNYTNALKDVCSVKVFRLPTF